MDSSAPFCDDRTSTSGWMILASVCLMSAASFRGRASRTLAPWPPTASRCCSLSRARCTTGAHAGASTLCTGGPRGDHAGHPVCIVRNNLVWCTRCNCCSANRSVPPPCHFDILAVDLSHHNDGCDDSAEAKPVRVGVGVRKMHSPSLAWSCYLRSKAITFGISTFIAYSIRKKNSCLIVPASKTKREEIHAKPKVNTIRATQSEFRWREFAVMKRMHRRNCRRSVGIGPVDEARRSAGGHGAAGSYERGADA